MFLRASFAIFLLFVAIATTSAASAQGFNAQEVKRANRIRTSLPDIGRPYTIRVTTGASTNAGFEKALVDADPSLKHWCWIPTTNMNQAYLRVAPGDTGTGRSYQRPKSCYVKPGRVPLPVIDHGQPQVVLRAAGSRSSRSRSDVSGKLSYLKDPAARSYGGETKTYTYSDVSGRISAPRYTAEVSDSKDVYGKLVGRQSTH